MKHLKLLFLLKQNYNYGYGSGLTSKAGLTNSAKMTAAALENHLNVETKLKEVIDGNGIDREIHLYKPDLVILEAIWVTPKKLAELSRLHPKVRFIVRVHSKTPFLAMEGISVDWIKDYANICHTYVSFNNEDTVKDFRGIIRKDYYLPNIYENVTADTAKYITDGALAIDLESLPLAPFHDREVVNIGCFGAIRPLKNQLEQAIAAIKFADKNEKVLHFHINATRVEQKGDPVLKNIRSLFKDTNHKLVEHVWYNREKFLDVVEKMDVGMQVSLTESFNIVTADFVLKGIPIIVGEDISWMPEICKVNPSDTTTMIKRLEAAIVHKYLFTALSKQHLRSYNAKAITEWSLFLQNYE